jgi:cyanate permease
MSFSGLSFIFWRIFQIITLIPALGMLAWFVDWYNSRGLLTPTSILVLFIVSVLGAAWALGTLFLYTRAKHSAKFVAFIDLLFMGAFIGAVYELRGIADADCSNWQRNGSYSTDLGLFTVSGDRFGLNVDRQCAMLKASWAFGIMNIIFFFITAILALLVHRHHRDDRVVVKREVHRSRHGHRSRSPRHSHQSHSRSRRSYV